MIKRCCNLRDKYIASLHSGENHWVQPMVSDHSTLMAGSSEEPDFPPPPPAPLLHSESSLERSESVEKEPPSSFPDLARRVSPLTPRRSALRRRDPPAYDPFLLAQLVQRSQAPFSRKSAGEGVEDHPEGTASAISLIARAVDGVFKVFPSAPRDSLPEDGPSGGCTTTAMFEPISAAEFYSDLETVRVLAASGPAKVRQELCRTIQLLIPAMAYRYFVVR